MAEVAPKVLIVTALLPEARALARALCFSGDLAQPVAVHGDLIIAQIGIGGTRLGSMGRLGKGVRGVVMAGLGGGLAPELRVGDVVVAGDMPGGVELGRGARVWRGGIHTSAGLVATPAEKARLFAQTGALAVDMETQHAQELAQRMRVPFLALRGISDSAQEAVDPAFLRLVDERGRPRVGRALALLLRHPSTVRAMLRMERATRCALSQVASVLVAVLATGWPDTPPEPGAAVKKNELIAKKF